MKPLDPRLLSHAASARSFFVLGAALGAVQTASIIGFAWLVTHLIVSAIAGERVVELLPWFGALLVVIAVRSAATWGMEAISARAAAKVKSELRSKLLASIAKLGPAWLTGTSSSRLTTLAGPGLGALDTYFAKYLPQLILTAIAAPVLIVVMALWDLPSAITVIITLPLIPVFMILIGWATEKVQKRQWTALSTLATGFLEVVEGLSTLKIFGRAERQPARIREVTDGYRVATMKVLRLSFMSGFALELLASLSVALIAVTIGIQLINRDMTLEVGLFVLLLAPEVYLPLRQVGAQFHAAADGVAASDDVFSIIEEAERAPTPSDARAAAAAAGGPISAGLQHRGLAFTGITVGYEGRTVLRDYSLVVPPGEVTAIVGPSGAGKSTLLGVARGTVGASGAVTIDGEQLTGDRRRAAIAWMGQSASLIEGTVAENVALGQPEAAPDEVRAALADAGLEFLDGERMLGVAGAGLSGGQSQRVALARTLLRARRLDCPVVLFDEPSSALDADTEQRIAAAFRSLAQEGRAVLVVSHRRALVASADSVHTIERLETVANA
ncbi:MULTISPECIES: thiol reductant ABC exporter subunit CydD [unclassified Pseudoclavibacter]|uniref:thiol reductant ABC exporter subunit CydD n=1 Tax=unclassified Pseudoclavibacter TaxID=2615177 RepID=UPI000CE74FC5|nr:MULTISPECIES: thiol reductant ABC exporter subunit CydD [unclassified Pseudoclavibacter]PPF34036.1 thiol reductant ABC exporter subunit CydD [Pseudoclavibacter sp. AY1H1]PPF76701.1 thiol reductant ABC exporter subunit CydD [Pseudoclavibacter sp. Z016]